MTCLNRGGEGEVVKAVAPWPPSLPLNAVAVCKPVMMLHEAAAPKSLDSGVPTRETLAAQLVYRFNKQLMEKREKEEAVQSLASLFGSAAGKGKGNIFPCILRIFHRKQ